MLTLSGVLLAGKYRVGARLGGGGMGEVYEAIQEGLGRRVAVKVMSGPMANDPQLLERFQREARAVAALGHPHIVSVTDFQDNPGEPPFLVMERLIGDSLGDLLEREPMIEPMRACRIAEQTLSALAAAHEANLVHRDVKPDNIFLCRSDTGAEIVKLLDFGVAKAMEEQQGKLTTTGAIVGTLHYMAPEQARGEPIDTRADIYALGAVMYTMLAGQPPFPPSSPARLLTAVCTESPTPLSMLRPDLDGTLVAIIARAMAHDARNRYPSARAMMSAIGSYLRGEAPTTDPMSATALAGQSPYSPRSPSGPYTGPPTPYPHPTSGGGVVVPPYAVIPSAPPPAQRASSFGIIFGLTMALVAVGAIGGAAWYVKSQHHAPVPKNETSPTQTAAPPLVDLAAATAQGGAPEISTLAPTALPTGPTTLPTAFNPTPQNTINTPVNPPMNPALANATTGQLVQQMIKAHTEGNGRVCLDAYDKLKAQPDFSDPANGYAMIHGDCLMAAGRCDEGRKMIRDYFSSPRPALQQMSSSQIDTTVSQMAMTYCPATQLSAPERVSRASQLLYKAQGSNDHAGAARYADEMAAQLPQLPRGTDDEHRKLVGYEYAIGKAYGDVGRCPDARKHFNAECSLNATSNVDACTTGLLHSTAGCKPP